MFDHGETEYQREETVYGTGSDEFAAHAERYESAADGGYWGASRAGETLPDGSIKVEDCGEPVPGTSGRGRVLDIVTMSDTEEDFAPMPLGGAERHWGEISVFSNLAGPRTILGARAPGSSRRQRQRQYEPVALDQLLPAGMECDSQHYQRADADDDLVRDGEFMMNYYSTSNDYQFY